jgi:hypothetical protein
MRNHGKATALSIDAVKRYPNGMPITRVTDHNAMHWSTNQSSKHQNIPIDSGDHLQSFLGDRSGEASRSPDSQRGEEPPS